ncbi:acyltransferase [Arthrobacter sp. Z1-9]
MAISSLAPARTTPAAQPKKISSFRPDIQGLRAVAVVAVILDHMFGFPSGGFVGVDVFFVISGFVITASLLREHSKSGRISFIDFYRHRARRILPAASLVLVLTVAASWFIFIGERARSVLWDGVWASLFGANWRFAATGTDYLQADGPTSPLQHYWSLSVEEQFYFVWPAVLVLTLGTLAIRMKWNPIVARRALGLGVLAVIVLSLTFAYWETINAPTIAYFSTFSRTWELGLGALVAVLIPVFGRIPAHLRPLLQWVGMLGIVASFFVVDTHTPFPVPGALLPVLSTALVILGGVGGQEFMGPLTNRAIRYVGDISYSLYLWHFPVIILGEAVLPSLGIVEYAVSVGLIIMLSVASYHFLEDPIRKSAWLEPRAVRKRWEPVSMTQGTKMMGLALLAVASLGLTGLAMIKDNPGPAQSAPIPEVTIGPAQSTEESTPEQKLQVKIAAALQTTAWPELQPSLDELGFDTWAPEIAQDNCLSVSDENLSRCAYGQPNAGKTAVVIGDSIAASWMPAIRSAMEGSGFRIQMLTFSGCPAFDVTLKAPAAAANCSGHRSWAAQKVNEIKPALILVSQAYEDSLETDGKTPEEQTREWKDAGTRFVATLPPTSSIAYIQGPKGGKDLTECATRTSTPQDCISEVNGFGKMIEQASHDAMLAAASSTRKAVYIPTASWFCVQEKCPAFVGNVPVRIDGSHLTGAYSSSLGPVLAPQLAQVLD